MEKNEQFDENDFNVFLREVAKMARQLQQERGPYHSGTLKECSINSEKPAERLQMMRSMKNVKCGD